MQNGNKLVSVCAYVYDDDDGDGGGDTGAFGTPKDAIVSASACTRADMRLMRKREYKSSVFVHKLDARETF